MTSRSPRNDRQPRTYRRRSGVSTLEYALVLGFVAGAVFLGLSILGCAVRSTFNQVAADLGSQVRQVPLSQPGDAVAPRPAPVPWTMRFSTWITFSSIAALAVLVMNLFVLRRALREKHQEQSERRLDVEELKDAVFQKRQEIFRILSNEMDSLLLDCRLKVRHVMSRHVTGVPPSMPVEEVRHAMEQKHVRHLLVCEGSKLLGIISDRDLAKKAAKTAAELMTAKPFSVEPDTPLNPAITQFVQRRISCLPVVDQGEVVGVLTSTDLMMTLQCALQVLKRVAGEVVADLEQDSLLTSGDRATVEGPDEPAEQLVMT